MGCNNQLKETWKGVKKSVDNLLFFVWWGGAVSNTLWDDQEIMKGKMENRCSGDIKGVLPGASWERWEGREKLI